MTTEEFNREIIYQLTMSMLRKMQKTGCITQADYAIIEPMIRQKYAPLLGSIY